MEIYRSYTLKIDKADVKLMRGNCVCKSIDNNDIREIAITTDSSLRHKYLGLIVSVILLSLGFYWLSITEYKWTWELFIILDMLLIPFLSITIGVYLIYTFIRKSYYLLITDKNKKKYKILIDDNLDYYTANTLLDHFHSLNIRSQLLAKVYA